MTTVSVVTGANSGIGRATAIHLASKGHEVYGTVRDPDRAEKLQRMAGEAGVTVKMVTLDVANQGSVEAGFAEILDRAGRVDVLVNNAGVGGNAVVEEATPESVLEAIEVNVNGALRCLREVLPGMRERGYGAIANVTSVAGRFGAVAQAPYVASKWAFEGLSEQLAYEMAPFGIRVVIIEPGVTKSAIFAKNTEMPNETGAYAEHYRKMFNFYAAGAMSASDPFEVAEVIHRAISTDEPKLRWPCSWGGEAIITGRAKMTDADWLELGRVSDDRVYNERFRKLFDIDLTLPPA